MGKVIISDNEIWAYNGDILKPNPEHFEEGHTTGATGKKPRHDQFNYLEQRRDLNIQYLLRMAGLPYDANEVYPVGAKASKNGHVYISLEDNNKGNDPISSGKWKHEDDDKFPVGTVIFNALDKRNPSIYKGFGTWEQVEAETTINMVSDANVNLGKITGENEKAIPVPLHNHNASFEGEEMQPHNHEQEPHRHGISNASYPIPSEGTWTLRATGSNTSVQSSNVTAVNQEASAGTPSGSVSIENAGDSDASISIQSKSINVIGWLRTN